MQDRKLYTFHHVSNISDVERVFECFYAYDSAISQHASEQSSLDHAGKDKITLRKDFINKFAHFSDNYLESPLNIKGEYGMWLINNEEGIDIGLISLERDDNFAEMLEIDIFFIPEYQGKRIGKDVVKLFHEEVFASFANKDIIIAGAKYASDGGLKINSDNLEIIKPLGISAKIKFDNRGSLATFMRAGYKAVDIEDCKEYKKVVMVYGNDALKQKFSYAETLSMFAHMFNNFLDAPTSPTFTRKKAAYQLYQEFVESNEHIKQIGFK